MSGEVIKQPLLAAALREIAIGGAAAFYSGAIGVALVDLMVEHGGLITAADLAGYTPEWTEPISTTYRGHWRVSTLTCPSPNYGVQLIAAVPKHAGTFSTRGVRPQHRARPAHDL